MHDICARAMNACSASLLTAHWQRLKLFMDNEHNSHHLELLHFLGAGFELRECPLEQVALPLGS